MLSAGLRAALCVGLGHFWLGRGRAAWGLLGAMHALVFGALLAWAYTASAGGLTAGLAGAALLLWLGQIAWAVRLARGGAVPPRRAPGSSLAFYLAAWAIGAVIGRGLLRPYALESFEIDADSMAPTLLHGDHLLVTKLGERAHRPQRGDVIALVGPGGALFVKRVVGLAGDRIETRDGWLLIDGAEAPVEPCAEPRYDYPGIDGLPRGGLCFVEGGHRILRSPELEAADFGPVVVPPDHVFVMGDNRDDSSDSRSFGAVPVADLIGQARVIGWSRERGRIGAVD